MTTWTTLVTPGRRATLMRRAQLLAGASVVYNTVEAVIAITAGNIAGSSALVGIELGQGSGQLHIAVVDDGVGISPSFDPEKSTSLGLSIVRGLVAELDGTITFGSARSDPAAGQRPGTRVALSIPVVRAPEPDATRPPGAGGRSVGL